MYDDLQLTIQNIVGDEATNDIIDTFYAFEEISYHDHILPTQDAMARREDNGNDWFIGMMRVICFDNMIILIKRMGINFDPDQEITLEHLLKVFTCLVRIERYPFKESILSIIENAETTIDAFNDILELFHGEEYQDLTDIFENVSPDLIEKMKDICIEELQVQEDEVEQTAPLAPEYLNLLNTFSFDFNGIKNQLITKLSEGALLVSMPITSFYNELIRNVIEVAEIDTVKSNDKNRHLAISKLIFTYTMIGYIKDAKNKTIDRNLASKIYTLIDTLQDDVIDLDESIHSSVLAEAMTDTFKDFSTKLAEIA